MPGVHQRLTQSMSRKANCYDNAAMENTRIREKLKGLSPVQYRTQSLHVA